MPCRLQVGDPQVGRAAIGPHRLLELVRVMVSVRVRVNQRVSVRVSVSVSVRVSARVSARFSVSVSVRVRVCLLYTSPSPRDQRGSRMPSSA